MTDVYKDFVFSSHDSDSWFYQKYYFAGSNARYWTFQLALNMLLQTRRGPVIIETGCQRMEDDLGAGMSSSIFGEFCSRYGGQLYTVDNTPQHIEVCKNCTYEYMDCIEYICNDSVATLEEMGKKGLQADLLYLDSVDFPIGDNAHDVGMRSLSQLHCMKEFDVALENNVIKPDTILLIDDNQLPYGGKPKLLKDKLIKLGNWQCLMDLQQSLWVQK